MQKNDVVKFKRETADEKRARETGKVIMRIVWIDFPRALVVSEIGQPINPTAVYHVDDLEVVKGSQS